MATLLEINDLFFNETLHKKVHGALFIVSAEIINEDDTSAPYDQSTGAHDRRAMWAYEINRNADGAGPMLRLILGTYSGLTAAQIEGASDAQILSAIRSAVDELSTAFI